MRFLLTVALVLAGAAPSAAATFSPADEARIVGLNSPVFAPDGRTIALVRVVQDLKADKARSALITVAVPGGAVHDLTPRKVAGVAAPAYAPDGLSLAFLAIDDKHVAQVAIVPSHGGTPRMLTHAKHGVQQFAWRPDGKAIAYVAQDDPPASIAAHRDFFEITNDDYLSRANDPPAHLWLVGADGRGNRRLTSGTWSLATSYPPSPPASPLAWTPDGRTLLFTRVPNTHDGDSYLSEIEALDVASGALHALTGRGKFEGFAALSPDGRRVAYLANRDDDPNNANDVFLTTLAGGRGTAISTKLDRNPWRAIWVDDRTVLVGSNEGVHQPIWFLHDDGSSTRVNTGGAEVSQGFWLQAAVGKGGAIAFIGTTSTHPAELWYTPSATDPAVPLTHVNDAIARLSLARSEEVRWTNDGFTQTGTLTYPVGYAPGKKYPLALVVHGGPTAASTLGFSGMTQAMAARGLFVFQPNYRGSDNGGNAFQRAIYMDAGAGPGRDVMAGVAEVLKTGAIDETRIGVSGWSYGGYMTSWLMTHYHIWKTAFSGAAVNDWVDQYDLGDGNVQVGFNFKGSPHVGHNIDDYRAQSPITYALDVTCPVLIMSDIGDARVPVTQSFRMYRILKDNGKPVRFIGIPVDGHNPGDIVRRIERERYWVDWAADGLK